MLTVEEIHVTLGDQPILRGVSLTVAAGEVVCLLGPSGCGKTTLLRVIAGLQASDSGTVQLDGHSLAGVPANRRGFGFMFQDFALFPHLNVADNVAFGLRMQGVPAQARQARVQAVLGLVNLGGFARRDVAGLSGGERQRVALARSLAPRPRFLMLDEPLGSLDAALRESVLLELNTIIRATGLAALYVTHDQREAFAIADRVAVMNAGHLEQIDTPVHLYQHPRTAFVAQFLGLNNQVSATDLAALHLPLPAAGEHFLLHPDGLRLSAATETPAFMAQVSEVVFQGDAVRLRIHHDSGLLLTFRQPTQESLPVVGDRVGIGVDGAAVLTLAG